LESNEIEQANRPAEFDEQVDVTVLPRVIASKRSEQ
jgi:hypothetical protein